MTTHYIECTDDFQERLQELIDRAKGETEFRFAPGTYRVRGSIDLSRSNSHLRFTSDGDATLTGAAVLTEWHPVAEADAARFHPSVRGRMMYCEPEADDMQSFYPRGMHRKSRHGHSELFADVPMQLTKYPRQGYTALSALGAVGAPDEWGASDGVMSKGFYWHDDRLKTWSRDNDIWALGYWKYDWATSMEQVDTFDPATGHIQMKPPYGVYGYRVGQRFSFYNIAEEIREPGDYIMDFARKRIYLCMPENAGAIRMTANDEPLFWVEESADITIDHLHLGSTCGSAIEAAQAVRLHIDSCSFERIGSCAVCIIDGDSPVVENCTIHNCGDAGIIMAGGDRCTLEPLNGRIFNNHIYDIARWGRCYLPAISLGGVGIEVRRNLIHDCPHTAIMYWGNEMKIAGNEIYRVVMETGDAGAVYSGRNFTFRGNEVSHNYIHHLGAGVGVGTMGIYNDDSISGTKMCDNYFEEVTRAIQLGGGRDFIVRNNVFVKCAPAVHFDSRSADMGSSWEVSPRTDMMDKFYHIGRYVTPYGMTERCLETRRDDGKTVSAMESVYITRYPELAKIDELYSNQIAVSKYFPGQALVEQNIFMNRIKFRYKVDDKAKRAWDRGAEIPYSRMLEEYVESPRWDLKRGIAGTVGEVLWINNLQGEKADFADVDWSDLQVVRTRNVYQHRHLPADFSAIGLMAEYRMENPLDLRTRVDYLPGSGVARIGVRNRADRPAEAVLYFTGSCDTCADVAELYVSVPAGSDAWYEIPVSGTDPDGVLEVWSDVPGVRPARSV
jgi:hypothetical protein